MDYLASMRDKGKRYFSFWWSEELKAVFWYREGTGDQEIWEFIQYLQSDEVKTERMIGDIVELVPYT